jgi:hypothetical protein
MLDELQRYAFGLKFENAFMREAGKSFEAFFSKIMSHAFIGDFVPVRPYGAKGDLKCDGYRSSDQTVFQCYAPDTMKIAALLKKMDQDFLGAVAHWGKRMQRWEFVHNDRRGLPAEAVQKLIDLSAAHPDVVLSECGEAALRATTMALELHQLEDLFGAVPSGRDLEQVDFQALRPVLMSIERVEPDLNAPLKAPSPEKLQRNALSQDAAGLLAVGRRRERLVESFFEQWPSPDFGEHIAQGFRSRYRALKGAGLSADQIFGELQAFCGGMSGAPLRQGAVLAVMSSFFERCDIFEDVKPTAPT